MKFDDEHKHFAWGLTAFLTGCALLLFFYVLNHFAVVAGIFDTVCEILTPVFMGLIFAYLLSPIINFMEKQFYRLPDRWLYHGAVGEARGKYKRNIRTLTILLTYILVFVALFGFFNLLIPELVSSIQNIVSRFPDYIANFEVWIDGLLVRFPKLQESVNDILNASTSGIEELIMNRLASTDGEETTAILSTTGGVVKGVISGGVSVLKLLLNILVGIMVSIYVVNSKELLLGQCKKVIYALMNRDRANSFIHNIRFTNKTFLGFFSGKIVDSIIIGILCFILTKIIGTPYATLISVVVGITNIIPYFGPFIGAIPCALLILMVDPRQCLYFIIMIILLQQFDGNILGPKILGQSTGLSSLWVIIAITIFGGLFKFAGMVIGVPVFAVLYTGISSYINARLMEKHLTLDTKKYVHVDYIDENDQFVKLPKSKVKRILSREAFKDLAKRNENETELLEAQVLLDLDEHRDSDNERNSQPSSADLKRSAKKKRK